MSEPHSSSVRQRPSRSLRVLLVLLAIAAWFATQALLARRPTAVAGIHDKLFEWTAAENFWLGAHPRAADALLASSSALVDALALFVLFSAIFGPSLRPLVGLVILFLLRQLCQALIAVPAPEGMIWRNPGVPSLLVTYGTVSDFFFSGHTAIATFAATELAHHGRAWRWLGIAAVVFEIAALAVLRAHYTMDMFTGIITALWAAGAAAVLAPHIDRLLLR